MTTYKHTRNNIPELLGQIKELRDDGDRFFQQIQSLTQQVRTGLLPLSDDLRAIWLFCWKRASVTGFFFVPHLEQVQKLEATVGGRAAARNFGPPPRAGSASGVKQSTDPSSGEQRRASQFLVRGPPPTESTMPRSCRELLRDDRTMESDNYWIDPDGSGPEAPIRVFCNAPTGTTVQSPETSAIVANRAASRKRSNTRQLKLGQNVILCFFSQRIVIWSNTIIVSRL